jgi:hypothetical protein
MAAPYLLTTFIYPNETCLYRVVDHTNPKNPIFYPSHKTISGAIRNFKTKPPIPFPKPYTIALPFYTIESLQEGYPEFFI